MAAKKKVVRKVRKKDAAAGGVSYRQITVEIFFTDREVKMGTFYCLKDVLGYIEAGVRGRYADSVRIELF